MVPVCVLARPGEQLRAGLSPAARAYARWRRAAAVGRGARRDAAAGLDAAVRADARPVLDRAPGARALEALSGAAVSGVGRRALLAGAAAALAAPALPRLAWAAASAASVESILAASGLGGGQRLRGRRPRRRRGAARGARRGRRAAAGLGREDRHRALCARGARPGLPLPHPGARRGAGRGRACCAATWCSRAAATRCSTPTGSAGWSPRSGPPGSTRVEGRFLVADGALPFAADVARDQPEDAGYNPTLSGLNLNFNRVQLSWAPGSRPPVFGAPGQKRAWCRSRASPARSGTGRSGTASRTGARSGRCRRRGSRARAATGCRCGRRRAYAGEVFAGLAAQAGLALPPAEVVARRRGDRSSRSATVRRSTGCCATCCAIRPT